LFKILIYRRMTEELRGFCGEKTFFFLNYA